MNRDEFYIRRCFALAQNGTGRVSPNPLVGAVLVKNDQVIGEGWHPAFGQAHAEVRAFENAAEDPAGSTLFCNLEPCSHTNKKTPPCTPLVISHQIKRVVLSNIDPNPLVAGNGIQQMRKAGIEVITGVLESEGARLNRFFFKHILSGIPYVTLKIAQSADGFTGRPGGQIWLTGEESRQWVHQQRAEIDVILIGANTLRVDNPQLNVRAVRGRNPHIAIIAGTRPVDPQALIFADPGDRKIFIFHPVTKKSTFHRPGVEWIGLPTNASGRILPAEILRWLGRTGYNSVLVEGGSDIFGQFLSENLWDEVQVIESPVRLKNGIQGISSTFMNSMPVAYETTLGSDRLHIFLPEHNS